MRKKIALGVALLLCVTIASFGVGKKEDAAGVLKITTWQFQEPTGGQFWNELLTKFQSLYPNVKVERVEAAGGTYWTKIFVDIVSGAPPDVMHVTMPDLMQMKGMKVLDPLDAWMDTTEIRKSFVKEETTMCAEGGKIYGLITGGRTLQMIVNKKLFEQAKAKIPTTPTELMEAAIAITKLGNENYGMILETGEENFENTYEYLLSFVAGFGGSFISKGKPTATSPEVIKAVTFYRDLVKAKVAPIGLPVNIHREMFYNGKIGMYIDGPWNFPTIQQNNPSLYPSMDAIQNPWPNKAAIGGPNHILVIPKDASNKALAGKFLSIVVNKDVQSLYQQKLGVVPGRLDAIAPDILQKTPWFKAYLEGADHAISAIPEGLEKRTVEVQKAVAQSLARILFRDQPVEQAMSELQVALQAIVDNK